MTNEEAVFSIFLMRFSLQPSEAIAIIQKWLTEHPADNWGTLNSLLKEDKVTVINGKIKEVSLKAPAKDKPVIAKYRGAEIQPKNLENVTFNQNITKKRRYRGQEY